MAAYGRSLIRETSPCIGTLTNGMIVLRRLGFGRLRPFSLVSPGRSQTNSWFVHFWLFSKHRKVLCVFKGGYAVFSGHVGIVYCLHNLPFQLLIIYLWLNLDCFILVCVETWHRRYFFVNFLFIYLLNWPNPPLSRAFAFCWVCLVANFVRILVKVIVHISWFDFVLSFSELLERLNFVAFGAEIDFLSPSILTVAALQWLWRFLIRLSGR